MSVTVLPQKRELKTYSVHCHGGKNLTVRAGCYFKSEFSYIFLPITHAEMTKEYMKGTLINIPPVLEIDQEAIMMIVDKDANPATVARKKSRRTAAKKKA